jgi:hypothetical protein
MNQPQCSNQNLIQTNTNSNDNTPASSNGWGEYIQSQEYQDFQDAMAQWEKEFENQKQQMWLNLDNHNRLLLLSLIVAKLHHAGKHGLSYRGTLYTEFEFDEGSYAPAQFSGLLTLHNAYDNKYDNIMTDYQKALELFNIEVTEDEVIKKHRTRFSKEPDERENLKNVLFALYQPTQEQQDIWNDLNSEEKLLIFCYVVSMIEAGKKENLDALACFEQKFSQELQVFEKMPVFKEYYDMVDNAPSYQLKNMQQGLSLFGIEISEEDIALKMKL